MLFIPASNVEVMMAIEVRAVRKAIRRQCFLKAADPGDELLA
jgi:hypothetical protein